MSGTITSADAVFVLSIAGLFPATKLQAFSADDMFSVDTVDPVELQMGVDGVLAAGWVPVMRRQSIMFLASSPSVTIFETWDAAQNTARDLFPASGTISLKSTGATYSLINGFLSTVSPMPDAKKVLQPRRFGITWQSISVSPI